ncbi:MAG: hypothetical protein HY527_05615 [Betaproteobacteria bacterium]|nr:hypothetical protein [Betaproteobacteria bacterium]
MRFFAFLEYTAVIIGVIGMIASKFFYLPKGFHLGLFLVGAGFALGGLESLFTRRMSFRFASHAGEGYAGAPALIWAGMALLIGAAFIASAYLMEEGLWRTTVNGLMRRPAPLLAAGGLIAAGAGALLMVNPRRHGIWWTLFVRVPKTLLGLLLIAAGVAAVGLGVWEWFEPQAFDRFSKKAWEQFDLRAIERLWRSLFGLRA